MNEFTEKVLPLARQMRGLSAYDYRNSDFLAVNQEIFAQLTEGPDAIFPVTT